MVKGDIFSDTALPISINKLASRSEINANMKSAFFQSIELQIVRQLIAGGAGGRGEALGYKL